MSLFPVPQGLFHGSELPQELLTDLLAYWKMDELANNAIDAHTGGYDLTEGGDGCDNGTGQLNGCRILDDTNNGTFTSSSIEISGTTGYTLAMWIYRPAAGKTNGLLFHNGVTSPNRGIQYLFSGTNLIVYHSTNGTDFTSMFAGTGFVAMDEWQHIAIVYDPGVSVTCYRNGAQFSQDTSVVSSIYAHGADFGFSNISGIDASLDEVAIWERPLAGYEIAQVYDNGNTLSYGEYL